MSMPICYFNLFKFVKLIMQNIPVIMKNKTFTGFIKISAILEIDKATKAKIYSDIQADFQRAFLAAQNCPA